MLASFIIAVGFGAFVMAQPPAGSCNTDVSTGVESCCLQGIPGASLCANVSWVPAQQAIKATISIGALQLLAYTFDANNTKACAGNPSQAAVCAQINNFTVTNQGCCGCMFVDVTIAQVFNLQDTIACFAFGTLQSCPNVACSNFQTCSSCTAQPQCGFCDSPTGAGSCDVGTQAGPQSGTCAAPSQWDYHYSQC
jgi:hypothetical protein